MKKRIVIGLVLVVAGIIFGLAETVYFGNNMYPQSRPERICDTVTAVLVITGTLLFTIGVNEWVNKQAKQ